MSKSWTVDDMLAGVCEVTDVGHPRPTSAEVIPLPPSPTDARDEDDFKSSMRAVYKSLGGNQAMLEFAKKNQRQFYMMMVKLLPQEFFIEQNVTHKVIIKSAIQPPHGWTPDASMRLINPLTEEDVLDALQALRPAARARIAAALQTMPLDPPTSPPDSL